MKTKSTIYKNGTNCLEIGTITYDKQEFSAHGAYITEINGKLQGILYAGDNDNFLSSWDGKIKVPCKVGSTWQGNFLDYHGLRQENRSYFFTLHGRKCRGVNYNRKWQDIVKFKEI